MKKRRASKSNLLAIIIVILLLLFVGLFIYFFISNNKVEKKLDDNYYANLNTLDYSESKQFDFDINSDDYMLIRLNDFKVLYEKNAKERIYPASLTKVVTMNAIVNSVSNLTDTSSYSEQEYYELINQNASIAYLQTDKQYSLKELLYALILESGADSAVALENYCNNNGINLIDKMNELVSSLNLTSSNFTNTTGLHDDNLYTSLNDYASVFINTLLNKDAKTILKTLSYNGDGLSFNSTLISLSSIDKANILGGKTGFTGEAGRCIACLYEANNRSYLLLLAKAYGEDYDLHLQDVNKIINELYN